MRIPQIITYAVREKGIEYKGEQICYNHDTSTCCGWWKVTSLVEATVNSEPVAIDIIELHLSERISKGVSQSVENSTKYVENF